MRLLLARLLDDDRGMMAVETAIVATVVALLSLGSFQISSFIARQNEMQGAVADAEAIVLAARPSTTDQLNTIRSIITTSTGLAADTSNNTDSTTPGVKVQFVYRCGSTTTLLTSSSTCNNSGSNKLWTYVRITLKDTYTPLWSSFGLRSGINLKVDRTVQVS